MCFDHYLKAVYPAKKISFCKLHMCLGWVEMMALGCILSWWLVQGQAEEHVLGRRYTCIYRQFLDNLFPILGSVLLFLYLVMGLSVAGSMLVSLSLYIVAVK